MRAAPRYVVFRFWLCYRLLVYFDHFTPRCYAAYVPLRFSCYAADYTAFAAALFFDAAPRAAAMRAARGARRARHDAPCAALLR